VAATVLEYGGSEDGAIAGLLHDAVGDQGGEPRLADIRNRFGDRGGDIVRSFSDSVVNTAAGQQKEDWGTRKVRDIDHLKTVDPETRLVALSDKVHNARSNVIGDDACLIVIKSDAEQRTLRPRRSNGPVPVP